MNKSSFFIVLLVVFSSFIMATPINVDCNAIIIKNVSMPLYGKTFYYWEYNTNANYTPNCSIFYNAFFNMSMNVFTADIQTARSTIYSKNETNGYYYTSTCSGKYCVRENNVQALGKLYTFPIMYQANTTIRLYVASGRTLTINEKWLRLTNLGNIGTYTCNTENCNAVFSSNQNKLVVYELNDDNANYGFELYNYSVDMGRNYTTIMNITEKSVWVYSIYFNNTYALMPVLKSISIGNLGQCVITPSFSTFKNLVMCTDGGLWISLYAKDPTEFRVLVNNSWYRTYIYYNGKIIIPTISYFPTYGWGSYQLSENNYQIVPVNEPAYFYDEESQSWYFLPPFAPTNTSLIYTSVVYIVPTESRTPQPKPLLPLKAECYRNQSNFHANIMLFTASNITTYTVNSTGGLTPINSEITTTYTKSFPILDNTTFIVKSENQSLCGYSTTTPINIPSVNIAQYKTYFAYPLFGIMLVLSTAFPLLSPFIIVINEMFDVVSATMLAVMIILTLLIGMTVNWHGSNTLRAYLSYVAIAFVYLVLSMNYFSLGSGNDIFATQTQQEAFNELNSTIANFTATIPINRQSHPDLNYEVYVYPKLLFDLIYLFLSTPYTIINIIKLTMIYLYPELSGMFALISGILVLALYGGLLLIGIRILLKPYIDF